MKLIKGMVGLTCENDLKIRKVHQVEGWIAEGTGLACTPYDPELIVNLASCKTWILTHIESGRTIWAAFPPDKQYAHIWIEEIAREEIDFTQESYALKARYSAVEAKLQIAHKRTLSRWKIIEREREKAQPEAQVEQLTLFEELIGEEK